MDKSLLLSGGTGFLGSRLCRALLERVPGRVFCLVRGRTPEGGARRLQARLDLGAAQRERIVPVAGDVRLPRLGLPQSEYDELAGRIDAVYHCAASVNLAADFERLIPSNVDGTCRIVEFARHIRPKHLHHVSTLGAFIAGGPDLVVRESDRPTWQTAGGIGYCETKVIGEAEVLAAGIPATIYRPGIILGDAVTGECSASDAVARMIRASAMLGIAPETDARVPVGSVDFTARAIAALSRSPGAAGQVLHPIEAEAFALREMFAHLHADGQVHKLVRVPDWHELMAVEPDSSAAFVMLAVWRAARHILAETDALRSPRFDTAHTAGLLAAEGVTPSALDGAYFRRMFARLLARPVKQKEADAGDARGRLADLGQG